MLTSFTNVYYPMYFILFLLFINSAHSQCANHRSYCLSGLNPSDQTAGICSYYEYVSINDGCEYFEHQQNIHIYIHWHNTHHSWLVGSNISAADYWALCIDRTLDDCIQGHWYLYYKHLNQTLIHYDLTIDACDYDNTECEAKYLHSTDVHTYAYDFCVTHTYHRSLNAIIARSYSLSGCTETQPFYTDNGYVLSWDNELHSWFITPVLNVPASYHYAFCTEADIVNCNHNWYIFNGETSEIDTKVISGYCNTCTDVRYDNVCIYFTKPPSTTLQFLEGTYKWQHCAQLKLSYFKQTGDTLKVHYSARNNAFVIDDGTFIYAKCVNVTAITDCTTNASWFVRYGSTSLFIPQATMRVRIGTCVDAYETTQATSTMTSLPALNTSEIKQFITTSHADQRTSTNPPFFRLSAEVEIVAIVCVAVVILCAFLVCAFCCQKHYHFKELNKEKQQYSSVPCDHDAETETENETKNPAAQTLDTIQPGASPKLRSHNSTDPINEIAPCAGSLCVQSSYSQKEGEKTEII